MKISLTLAILFLTVVSFAQPKMVFDSKVYKFGKIPPGDTLRMEFPFVNEGDDNLIITRAKVYPPCECTQVIYPREPIPPSFEGMIEVIFDTNKKIGYQERSITLIYNSNHSPVELKFKGKVDENAKPQEENY